MDSIKELEAAVNAINIISEFIKSSIQANTLNRLEPLENVGMNCCSIFRLSNMYKLVEDRNDNGR